MLLDMANTCLSAWRRQSVGPLRASLFVSPRLWRICTSNIRKRFSSLLKNLEIGALPVFLPWALGRSGCCERTVTYAVSSLGMRIRL